MEVMTSEKFFLHISQATNVLHEDFPLWGQAHEAV